MIYLFFIMLYFCDNSFGLNYFSTDEVALTKDHIGVQHLLMRNADVIEIPAVRREDGKIAHNSIIYANEYRGLSNLKYAQIPDSVTILGENAFRNCDLRMVYLNKVTNVGSRCFSGNHMLELVVIPEFCPFFDTMCFAECGDYLTHGLTIVCQDVTSVLNIKYKFGNWNCQVVDFLEGHNMGFDEKYGLDFTRYIE